ncbi:hypothetical protein Q8G31_23820 [Priestia megaterium]|uniref:hypothetical protein n=1 Tax=Priestia megaterium TaxID=1404 RepID=UPI0027310550|nr:hypothetical protein [Priestia megaterium]MDP1383048.1 hypothetical protein [Priestia megaterium]MDP1426906.1 hypothetical protein [Priestia megaterium]
MYRAGNSVEQVFGGTVIKQGDRTPLGFNFRTENGELVYLTGSTVQVKVASDKGVVLEKEAAISDEYTAQFAIGSQDITGSGDMRIEFIVTYPGGTIEKFPSDDWQRIRITPTLEDVEKYGVGYITFEKLTDEFQNQFDEFTGGVDQQIGYQKQRVDNLINSTPQPSEIVDARLDESGNIFSNLKALLDDKGMKINKLLKKNEWFVSIYEYVHLVIGDDWYFAIQQAINDTKETKKAVLVPYGRFGKSKELTIYRYTKLFGIGKDLSEIYNLNGSNCDIIKTYKFDTYTGTTITGSTEDAANLDVPIAFEIRDLALDGNFANNTSGYGLRIYGKHYLIDNVIIKRVPDVSFYSEYGNNYIYKAEDTPETFINLEVHESGGENVIFNGPSDISITRLYCGWAGKKYGDSKYFAGEKVHSVTFLKGAELGELHAFENEYGYAFRFAGSSARYHADLIIGESAHGSVRQDQGASLNASIIRSHSNRSNVNPNILINSDLGSICTGLDIRRYATDGTAPCLQINKENYHFEGFVLGNASGGSKGNGVVVNSHHGKIDVDIRYLHNDGTTQYYGLITNQTGVFKRNHITARIQGCDNAWYNSNKGIGSTYNIAMNFNSANGNTGFTGQPKNTHLETWNVHSDNNGEYRSTDYTRLVANSINLATTNEQTLTFAHYYLYAPTLDQVQTQLVDTTALTDYEVAYIKVVSADATNVTVKVKLKIASVTTGQWASLRVGIR